MLSLKNIFLNNSIINWMTSLNNMQEIFILQLFSYVYNMFSVSRYLRHKEILRTKTFHLIFLMDLKLYVIILFNKRLQNIVMILGKSCYMNTNWILNLNMETIKYQYFYCRDWKHMRG